MSLLLPYYASRPMSLPNAVAGYSNTGLRRLQQTSGGGWIRPPFMRLVRFAVQPESSPVDQRPR